MFSFSLLFLNLNFNFFPFYYFYLCVCMVCVCVNVGTHVHSIHVEGGVRPHFLLFFDAGLVFLRVGPTSWPLSFRMLLLLGLQTLCNIWFTCVCWDSESGPGTWVASSLPTEPSSQAILFLVTRSSSWKDLTRLRDF